MRWVPFSHNSSSHSFVVTFLFYDWRLFLDDFSGCHWFFLLCFFFQSVADTNEEKSWIIFMVWAVNLVKITMGKQKMLQEIFSFALCGFENKNFNWCKAFQRGLARVILCSYYSYFWGLSVFSFKLYDGVYCYQSSTLSWYCIPSYLLSHFRQATFGNYVTESRHFTCSVAQKNVKLWYMGGKLGFLAK